MSAKRDKFVELAERRVNKTLHDLRLVGNLSNKSNYEYSDQDVSKILKALEEGVTDVKRRFRSPTGNDLSTFKLEEK